MSLTRRICGYAGVGLAVGLGVLVYWVFLAPVRELPPPSQDERSVVVAYNETALQLYKELRPEPGNLVLSPYSIGTAMAMARTGARGDTEAQMAMVLNHPFGRERMDAANADLMKRLNRGGRREDDVLAIANALCLTGGEHSVHESYRKLLQEKYAAEIFTSPDVGPINAWVKGKTRGKIEEILKELSPASVCVLLNAIHFKGKWANQFDAEGTHSKGFHTTADTTIPVPMMHQSTEYALVEEEELQAVSLPYRTPSVEMIIILPRERLGLASIEDKLSLGALQAIIDGLRRSAPKNVVLALPRFRIEFGADLIPPFEALGMELPFTMAADFGGITGHPSDPGAIWIAQIQHKAFLEVNEEGSEAAAATAVEYEMAEAQKGVQFRADHPFLFLIVEVKTNAILFLGRVTNPLE
jgi:serpin B